MSEQELKDLFKNAPTNELFLDPGTTVLDVVMAAKCFSRDGKCYVLFRIEKRWFMIELEFLKVVKL